MYKLNKKAFSMLEAIIAFSVLIVGIGAIIGFYGYIMHSNVGKTQREVAKVIALNVMDYLSYYIPENLPTSDLLILESGIIQKYLIEVKRSGDFTLYSTDDPNGSIVLSYAGTTKLDGTTPVAGLTHLLSKYEGNINAANTSYVLYITTDSVENVKSVIDVKVEVNYKYLTKVKVGSGVYSVPPAKFIVETAIPLDF